MTVAELIAFLQLLPQDAVVVQPRQNELADAFVVFGLYSEPRTVQMRSIQKWRGFPLPLESYEIVGDGNVRGVILE